MKKFLCLGLALGLLASGVALQNENTLSGDAPFLISPKITNQGHSNPIPGGLPGTVDFMDKTMAQKPEAEQPFLISPKISNSGHHDSTTDGSRLPESSDFMRKDLAEATDFDQPFMISPRISNSGHHDSAIDGSRLPESSDFMTKTAG